MKIILFSPLALLDHPSNQKVPCIFHIPFFLILLIILLIDDDDIDDDRDDDDSDDDEIF